MRGRFQRFFGAAGNPRGRFIAAAVVLGAGTAAAPAGTYQFIPGVGTASPNPTGTSNWADTASWTTGGTAGTLPGSADQASSATGATTVINTLVPTVNEIRWANAVPGSTVATVNGTVYKAPNPETATLEIDPGGVLNITSTNGTGNGNFLLGRAQPSLGVLNMTGGFLTTGSTMPITNDSAANISIGDIAGSNGSAVGAANSTMNISGGTVNAANNFILGNMFVAVSGTPTIATGTVNQTGGAINVAGAVEIGANGKGTYNMSGGALRQEGTNPDGSPLGRDAFFVGRNGNGTGNPGASGTFIQSGSALVSIANGLYIANGTGTTGSYTISGGTLSIAGEIKVGASTNSAGASVTGNTGSFTIVGHDALTITANRLTANTANSTLGFTISSIAGTSLLDLASGDGLDGSAILSPSTKIDLTSANGFAPTTGDSFELLRAATFTGISSSSLPSLTTDAAFADATLSIVNNSDNTESLVATINVPEPAGSCTIAIAGFLAARRRRC